MPDGERPQLRASAVPAVLLVCPICQASRTNADAALEPPLISLFSARKVEFIVTTNRC